MHWDIRTKTLQTASCCRKIWSLSTGVKVHPVSVVRGGVSREMCFSSALCSYSLLPAVIVTITHLYKRRLCRWWGMICALLRYEPSHRGVVVCLGSGFGFFLCLKFPSGSSATSSLASERATNRKLIMAFLHRDRVTVSHQEPLVPTFTNHSGPYQVAAVLSAGPGRCRHGHPLPRAAAMFLKAFSSR